MDNLRKKPVFRFAPSPNGCLHLGHAYSAIYSWQMAKEYGGIFLVRIEDIDHERSRPEFITQIFDDLAWLGLSWEEPVLLQSSRMNAYEDALNLLRDKDLIYPSSLTRKDIQKISSQRNKDPDGAPMIRQEDEPDIQHDSYNWRLNVDKAMKLASKTLFFEECNSGPMGEKGLVNITPAIWGNVVLARKHTPTSYHLSVVVDDSYQNVSHVTRGQDLFYATYIHVLLQHILCLPTPVYFHHPLIKNETGHKLSKTALDKSLKSLREEGITREDIIKYIPIKL